jgi:hypothetical protein
MGLKVNLYKNNNSKSKGYNMIYSRVENDKPMTLDELAAHMHDHNSPYDEGIILGVLKQMTRCIRELILDGKPVKLTDLCIFKAAVTSGPAASYLAYDLGKDVKKVRLACFACGKFTRSELAKASKLSYTSLAQSLRDAEAEQQQEDDDDNP